MLNKIIILLFLVSLAIISVFILTTTSAPKKSPVVSPIPSITPSIPAESSLSFTPEILYAKKGLENSVDIQINSQGKYPTLLQLELAYDPEFISDLSLTPGTLFSDPDVLLNLIDEKNGRISYAIGLKPNQKTTIRNGTAAKLNFSINKNSRLLQSSIYFLPKTSILSDGTNIPLKIATGLEITINPSSISTNSPNLR